LSILRTVKIVTYSLAAASYNIRWKGGMMEVLIAEPGPDDESRRADVEEVLRRIDVAVRMAKSGSFIGPTLMGGQRYPIADISPN
jgi:hypothetical protein